MGFECGLYKVKKFNNLSLQQIKAINCYYDYYENDWARDNYATWQSYCKSYELSNLDTNVTQEDIDNYKDEYIERDYYKSLYDTVDSWCSSGKTFHDYFCNIGEKINYGLVTLSKDNIIEALNWCSIQLKEFQFKKVIVQRAFSYNDDTEEIRSIPCSGVEVEDEDENIKREYCDDWELTNLFIPSNGYFDESKYYALTALLDALISILADTDFENEIVYYEGG